jgi:hypothetical protein
VRLPQALDSLGILDRRLDLEPVADNPRIAEQAIDVVGSKRSDPIRMEFRKGCTKRSRFFKIVSQDKPAWLICSTSRSKSTFLSVVGKPYSTS